MQAGCHVMHLRAPSGAAPLRQALQAWLGEVSPVRYGLPRQAIVAVRQLRLRRDAIGLRDPLVAALRAAARPAVQGFVPATAPAVWFSDEAELLACVARVVLSGDSAMHWWWPLLLVGREPAAAAALRRWLQGARAVPWALVQPALREQAGPWLAQLGSSGRAELLQALRQHHPIGDAALHWMQAAETGAGDAVIAPRQARPAFAGWAAPHASTEGAAAAVTPLRAWQALCALLRESPQALCGDEAPRWLQERVEAGPLATDTAHGVTMPSEPASWASVPARPQEERAPAAGPLAPEIRSRVRSGIVVLPPVDAVPAAALPVSRPLQVGPGRAPVVTMNGLQSERIAERQPAPRSERAAPARHAACVIDSAHAGLFFLLNMALDAGLYGDFTQPRHEGLALSPWRFLHWMGAWALGRRFRADPLAHWLALQPGASGPLPPAPPLWRAPAAWLQPFEEDLRPWTALRAANGLRLLHPAGFIAAQALGPAAALDLPPATPVRRAARPLRLHHGLLGLLAPWLACRLARALGLPVAAPAWALVARLPGQLHGQGQRLDVCFSLASLPLCLRLAGLDRDPGWLPAAGCDLRFHFD